MTKKRTGLIAAVIAAIFAAAAIGAGIAVAAGGDDAESPITGVALEKASAAALAAVGGGRVTGTEVEDEDGFYEVEVTRADGSQVDVHLDRDFSALGEKSDSDDPSDED